MALITAVLFIVGGMFLSQGGEVLFKSSDPIFLEWKHTQTAANIMKQSLKTLILQNNLCVVQQKAFCVPVSWYAHLNECHQFRLPGHKALCGNHIDQVTPVNQSES
ncbi:hypothetical protein GOODEAATRI_034048 [Goodea atripinnis]|uniref:Uncharacterized protein n=1 Tax=Goodea atripinnis TaxID=208336 RepID=A0ABV0P2P3_9TELE